MLHDFNIFKLTRFKEDMYTLYNLIDVVLRYVDLMEWLSNVIRQEFVTDGL